jgi:hypothetical protein
MNNEQYLKKRQELAQKLIGLEIVTLLNNESVMRHIYDKVLKRSKEISPFTDNEMGDAFIAVVDKLSK